MRPSNLTNNESFPAVGVSIFYVVFLAGLQKYLDPAYKGKSQYSMSDCRYWLINKVERSSGEILKSCQSDAGAPDKRPPLATKETVPGMIGRLSSPCLPSHTLYSVERSSVSSK